MIQFQNWYEATLTSPITATALNIPLTPVPPIITEGILVLDYDNPSLREIVHFTSKDGVSVNIPASGDTGTTGTGRGYESTTARNHAQNAKVRMMLTAGVATAIQTGAATIANQNNNGGWVARSETPVYATNNGQKEFTFTVPGDLTGVIPVGAKIKMDRVVAPPTQAMSFTAASSQYATKATPSGFSFTAAFTCEGWVYLNSYQVGSQAIVNKEDLAATGFSLHVNATGQVESYYRTTGAATVFTSYQSVPLKRWVHIAIAVTSVASKTANIFINGVLVSSVVGGNNATVLTQGTSPLQIGKLSTTSSYLDGYVAEVRVWAVAQTQSQILANQFINLIGNEANLVFCARGNGDYNDRTINANNLTATNGATFVTLSTTGAVPYYYNPTEMFIVNGIPTYTLPNTTITCYGGMNFGLPNAAMQNLYFSSQRAPFGFPASRGKWQVTTLLRNNQSQSSPSVGVWYNPGSTQLAIPTGEWDVKYWAESNVSAGTAGNLSVVTTLSNANNTESDTSWSAATQTQASLTLNNGTVNMGGNVSNTVQTPYYLNVKTLNGGITGIGFNALATNTKIVAECAYI